MLRRWRGQSKYYKERICIVRPLLPWEVAHRKTGGSFGEPKAIRWDVEAECALTLDKGSTEVSRRSQAEPRKGRSVSVCRWGAPLQLYKICTQEHPGALGRKLKWNKKEMPSLAIQTKARLPFW